MRVGYPLAAQPSACSKLTGVKQDAGRRPLLLPIMVGITPASSHSAANQTAKPGRLVPVLGCWVSSRYVGAPHFY